MNSLFNRYYGYQYTKYEFESMRRIKEYMIRRTNELRGYIITKPILSLHNNSDVNILYNNSGVDLTLDSIYVYYKIDEFTLYDVLKFIAYI